MIANEAQLKMTLEQLGLMLSSLASLRDEVLPVNPGLYTVMAEGPLDMVRQLENELHEYAGIAAAEEHINRLDSQMPEAQEEISAV